MSFENTFDIDNDFIDMRPNYCVKHYGEDNLYFAIFSLIVFNPILPLTIEQMYNRNKVEYIVAAEKHPYYPVITNSYCTVDQIELAHKLLGLFAVEGDKAILDLMKKGWPQFYNALERLRTKQDSTICKYIMEGIIKYEHELMIAYYFRVYDPGVLEFPIGFDLEDNVLGSRLKPIAYPQNKTTIPVSGKKLDYFKTIFGINENNFNKADFYFKDLEDVDIDFFGLLTEFAREAYINPYQVSVSVINPEIMKSIISLECLEYFNNDMKDKADIVKDFWIAIFITYIGQEYKKLKEMYFRLKKEKTNYGMQQEIKDVQKENKKLKAEFSKKERVIADLETHLSLEKNKNRKSDAKLDKEYKDELKNIERKANKKIVSLEKENEMLRDMLDELLQSKENRSFIEDEYVSFEEKLHFVRNTPNILYVGCEDSSTGKNKIEKLKRMLKNCKFCTSERDSIPTKIDFIFFDYHILTHSLYYKIKDIGKRGNIPIFNIQSINPGQNIEEMYYFIKDRELSR